jgi:hypothetical protein
MLMVPIDRLQHNSTGADAIRELLELIDPASHLNLHRRRWLHATERNM